jgi:riboflavin synthase
MAGRGAVKDAPRGARKNSEEVGRPEGRRIEELCVFRGIVEGTGRVAARRAGTAAERLEVELPAIAAELEVGQSVAINGTCLTVVTAPAPGGFASFDLAGETLRRSNLGDLKRGDLVNYERAMRLTDRIDGHLLQGHVDGTATIRSFEERHGDRWLELDVPQDLMKWMVPKGCVAVDGISLTIAALDARSLACTIVPHTFAVTNLVRRRTGERVNLEADVLIKWLERLNDQSLGRSRGEPGDERGGRMS